jgi:hypothetical protein
MKGKKDHVYAMDDVEVTIQQQQQPNMNLNPLALPCSIALSYTFIDAKCNFHVQFA